MTETTSGVWGRAVEAAAEALLGPSESDLPAPIRELALGQCREAAVKMLAAALPVLRPEIAAMVASATSEMIVRCNDTADKYGVDRDVAHIILAQACGDSAKRVRRFGQDKQS